MKDVQDIFDFFNEKTNKIQNGIPTFFDNFVFHVLQNGYKDDGGVLRSIIESKKIRFSTFEDRIKKIKSLPEVPVDNYTYLTQGVHSVYKWKGMDMFKSNVDLSVYSMMIDELKPDTIIEYGSGNGSSAIWLSDMCNIHNLNTKIISYDINKVNLNYSKVEFKNIDLKDLELNKSDLVGRKIVIEDAHQHVHDVLVKTDLFLQSGDYLVIEDSECKQDIIFNFLNIAKNKYVVDNYYVDFFGINSGSTKNSIFKVV